MSLTALLKTREVRRLFGKTFEFKQFNIERPIRAEPLTDHYMMVGTAFDYLARWQLERRFPDAQTTTWVAEMALDTLKNIRQNSLTAAASLEFSSPAKKEQRLRELDAWHRHGIDKGRQILEDAKRRHAEWMKTGTLDDGLVDAAIRLVKLDSIYRTGSHANLDALIDPADRQDLRNLWHVMMDGDLYRELSGPISMNPSFGSASKLVDGADADLISDGILIDIKTTKCNRFTRAYFDQLVGYYVLSRLDERRAVTRLAIYFSRHGALCIIPADEAVKGANIADFVESLIEAADRARAGRQAG